MKNLITLGTIGLAASSFAQVQLSDGHMDLGLAYEAGAWDPHIHVHDGDIEYAPDEAYFYYGAASQSTRPAGSAYDFIGVAAGQTIFRNYTNNVVGIPWLGFGFEEIAPGTFGSYVQTDPRRDPINAEWVDVELLSYTSSNGGHAAFFQGGGTAPTVWFATADGIDSSDRFISTVGGHEHGSFVFSASGTYELTFRGSAILNGQRIYSDEYTYTFGVMQTVPEPVTVASLGLGTLLVAIRRRRNQK